MTEGKDQDSLSILFIGNSYFWMNDMPSTFKEIARYGGKNVYIDSYLVSNTSLTDHVNDEKCHAKIASQDWDLIVVIGSSSAVAYPEIINHDPDYTILEEFCNIVYSICNNCQVMFCMPWAYETGVILPDGRRDDFEAMQYKIYTNTVEFCSRENVIIAPIGWAWQKALQGKNYPLHYLHDVDTYHPNVLGTYLGACVIFSCIYRQTCFGTYFNPGFSFEDKRYLQEIASTTVLSSLSTWNIPGDPTSTGLVDRGPSGPRIYPNPGPGTFTLESHGASRGPLKIKIYNLLGIKIYESLIVNENGSIIRLINPGNLPSGYYVLLLEGKSGASSKIPFMVKSHQ